VEQLRIFVADDHTLVREALRVLLSARRDLVVVGEAGTAKETLEHAPIAKADVILLDIKFPDRSGISLLPELRSLCPSMRVLVLTMHDEPEYLRSSLAAGASGYVVKSSPFSVLQEAIHAVKRGETFIDPSLREYSIEPQGEARSADAVPLSRLSKRERQVLTMLAQGLRYQAIAEKLGVSVKTVETYRTRLRTKLGFKNRADIIRFAFESGILTREPPPD
jgi:two-component system response regulator NreC